MELKRLLVPLDGSELAREALILAHRLVVGVADPTITLLQVVEGHASDGPERARAAALRDLQTEAEAVLGDVLQARRSLSTPGPYAPRVAPMVEVGRPAEHILAAASRSGAEVVVMTTHGRSGLGRVVRGSVAEDVLRRSPVPVLLGTARSARLGSQRSPFQRLLVPLDGSALAYRALPLAATVARASNAEVVLLRVQTGDEQTVGTLVEAQSVLDREGVARVSLLRACAPAAAPAILAAVEERRVDLIVMTTHGRAGLERLRLGSVAEEVLRASACPVLLLRT